MNKKRKNNLKIIAATSMVIFTLFSAFTAAYAWFTSVRARVINNDDFNVQAHPGIIKRIKVFNQVANVPYVFKSTPAKIYDVNDEDVTLNTSNEDITIRSYASLDEYPDATLLYLFELDATSASSDDEYFIKMKTETPDSSASGANGTNGSLVYRDNAGYPIHPVVFDVTPEKKAQMQQEDPNLDDSYFGLNSMSSVISFSAKTFETLTPSNNQYDLRSDYSSVTAVNFVNANNNQGETTFSYTSSSLDAYRRAVGSNDTVPNYVGVVCHYNAASLQYIININLGNPASDYEEIRFTVDWYFEIK